MADQTSEECEMSNTKYSKTCPDSRADHCLKISGEVDGKATGLRQCSDENWGKLVGGKDKCVSTSSIPNFSFKLDNRPVKLENGMVCACTEDGCNSQGRMIPSVFAGMTTLLMAIFLPKFY